MYNPNASLVTTLKTVLPNVYYERHFNTEVTLPCITYIESGNSTYADGNTIRISRINYTIKVWGTSIDTVNGYAESVDTALFNANYQRTSANDFINGDIVIKIMNYEALAKEEITIGDNE